MTEWLDGLFDTSAAPPSRGRGPSVLRQQYEEQLAADRAVFQATMAKIFAGDGAEQAARDLLRAVVEGEQWLVAVDDSGALQPEDRRSGRYRLAIGDEAQKGAKSSRRSGKGGRLLSVYAQAPGRAVKPLDGRTLVRSLPAGLDGLLLHLSDGSPRELRSEHFADLEILAAAVDLEDILARPAPGQVEALLAATWWVRTDGDGQLGVSEWEGLSTVSVYTCPQPRLGLPVTPMDGRRLFGLVAASDRIDAVVVESGVGRGLDRIHRLALPPAFASRLLAGEDLRPGVAPLPARTRQEVELWLHFRRFPREDREWVVAPLEDCTLIRARVPRATEWRDQETDGEQRPGPNPTWSPVFQLERGAESLPGWGEGPSRILCPGKLARELNVSARSNRDPAAFWRVGRNLLLGWLLDEQDVQRSQKRLAMAQELAKLLPAGADRIPRSALLSVEGAAVLRQHPHGATREWIEETVRQAERFTKRWVPR